MNNFIQNSIYQHNWIVPRSVMCTLFWTGVILVFTGMILLVTSNHKGEMYQSWGGVLLGLGLCILLICLILCIHAYCVMAADAAAASPEQDIDDQPSFIATPSEGAVGNFHQSLDAIKADLYSNASLANGRKPRSTAQLIPPPKFGVSVTKPTTHTVRFFLSDSNGALHNGEEDEKEKEAAVKLKTVSKEEAEKFSDRQLPFKTMSDATSSGGNVVGDNIRSSTGRPPQSSPAKERRIQTTTPTSPPTTTVVDQRFSGDRNPVLSSDCDSLLSVETIIPRTLLGNKTADDETGRMTATSYDFLDDGRGVEEEETEVVDRRRVIVDPSEGRLSSSSGSAKKKVSGPYPGRSPSSVSRGDGKTSLPSRETHRHSYLKSKQQHYSSETSPSPGSPDHPHEEAAAVSSIPPVKSTMGTKPSGGPTRPSAVPLMAPGAWSITRNFGPSSVTVTPLGTHEPASIQNVKGGEGVQALYHHHYQHQQHQHQQYHPQQYHPQQHHHQQHRHQGSEFTQTKEPTSRGRAMQDEMDMDQYRTGKRDDPVGAWRSMEKHRQLHPVAADRYMPPPPPQLNPSPAPAALEMTESKATVYDNVQYFQM